MSRRRSTRGFGGGDFTLNDFANAEPGHKSRKKTSLKIHVREDLQRSETSQVDDDDDVSWFDKDLEEFGDVDIPLDDDRKPDVNEVEKKTARIRSQRRAKSSTRLTSVSSDVSDSGFEYPAHVWFLLSEYIRPEDVVSFSCICRSAYMATSSVKFWITLYRRYYNKQIKVPERLTPVCMERPRGLKACVVRTLFLTYPPFVERTRMPAGGSPSETLRRKLLLSYCVLAWHRQTDTSTKTLWNFYFKFQKCRRQIYPAAHHADDHGHQVWSESSSHLPDLLDFLRDIDANDEKDCRVLKVTCTRYVAVPALMGMFLTDIGVASPTGDWHKSLRLTFSKNAYCQPARRRNEDDVTVVIEPSLGAHALDWWHPQYPYLC